MQSEAATNGAAEPTATAADSATAQPKAGSGPQGYVGREPKVGRPAMVVVHECIAQGMGVADTVSAVKARGYICDYSDVLRAWRSARDWHMRTHANSPWRGEAGKRYSYTGQSKAPKAKRVASAHKNVSPIGSTPKIGTLAYWVCQHNRNIAAKELIARARDLGLRVPTPVNVSQARTYYRHVFDAKGRSTLDKKPPPRGDHGRASPGQGPRGRGSRAQSATSTGRPAPSPSPPPPAARGSVSNGAAADDPQVMQLKALILDMGLTRAQTVFEEFAHIRDRVTR